MPRKACYPVMWPTAARQWIQTAAAISLFVAHVGAVSTAHSQQPAPSRANAETGLEVPGDFSADEIRQALARARERLAAIEAEGETPADAPPGTRTADISQRLALARTLAITYEKQLSALERAETARKRLAEAQRANGEWRGANLAPPYSLLEVDQLRDELQTARHAEENARSTMAMLMRLVDGYESKLRASRAAARLAAEAADRARGTPEQGSLEWTRQLAALHAQVDVAIQSLLQISLRAAQVDSDAAQAMEALATRKLKTLGSDVALLPADLDKVLSEIDVRRRNAERELTVATKSLAAASTELARAGQRLAQARTPVPGVPAISAPDFEQEAALARELEATASQRVFLLREHLLQLDGEKMAWETRATAVNQRDPVRARAAHDRLTESLAGLRASSQYLTQQLAAADSRLRDEEARQRGATFVETAASKRLIETLRQRQRDLRKALDDAVPLSRLISHFRTDFEDRREASFGARLRDHWAAALLTARDVWSFELFAIDDTLETAEGKKIAVSRSVTVGKTFGAALIVLIGYWIAGFVLRRVEQKLVRDGRASAQGAALLRKWVHFIVAAMLALVALLSASIPLSAFAFLGGALAIAAGFGLQTLLKNLVSGVMLLVERPLRLGDLVEVDGIRGRVTEIGIRASTIRSADGIESIIPNSRFIEGTMTNWTYSSPRARQTAQIGVAYGTPLRKAAEILGEVLERHGLVLKDPAPQVYLEAYDDSSIDFSVNYWVEMTELGDIRRVKSDLLLMIDRAFEEAGIEIPFPQRVVHISSTKPVPVTVVGSADSVAAS